jgi:hypothetical protein
MSNMHTILCFSRPSPAALCLGFQRRVVDLVLQLISLRRASRRPLATLGCAVCHTPWLYVIRNFDYGERFRLRQILK